MHVGEENRDENVIWRIKSLGALVKTRYVSRVHTALYSIKSTINQRSGASTTTRTGLSVDARRYSVTTAMSTTLVVQLENFLAVEH